MPPTSRKQNPSHKDQGLEGFARFLRSYGKAWPVLIACVIGPLFRCFKMLPMYKAHEGLAYGIVSIYGLLCAIALYHYRPAFLRNRIAAKALPAILIAVSFGSIALYLFTINRSIRIETDFASSVGVDTSQLMPDQILARTALQHVPFSEQLITFYLIGFFGAETALVLFALREYAQPQHQRTTPKVRRHGD